MIEARNFWSNLAQERPQDKTIGKSLAWAEREVARLGGAPGHTETEPKPREIRTVAVAEPEASPPPSSPVQTATSPATGSSGAASGALSAKDTVALRAAAA